MFGFFTSYQTGLILLDSLHMVVLVTTILYKWGSSRYGPGSTVIFNYHFNKDISSSKLISFADDTRIYSKITDVSDCDNYLQFDLNMIYDWAIGPPDRKQFQGRGDGLYILLHPLRTPMGT